MGEINAFKRAFITGWPTEHSRSPLIHNYWIEKYGLEGSYEKHPCSVEEVSSFISSLSASGYVGGNVTIPHKEIVSKLVNVLHPTAKKLGAVNTVWHQDGIIHGDNTDGYGFLANLNEHFTGWNSPASLEKGALVLGAGGASRAIIVALLDEGFTKVVIANRTFERAENLAIKFGPKCYPAKLGALPDDIYQCAILVNTTSVGMDGAASPIDLALFSKQTLVHDIIYTPLMTPLLTEAKNRGLNYVDGLGMLLHQAAPGFERWFGIRPTVTNELRELLLQDLENSR